MEPKPLEMDSWVRVNQALTWARMKGYDPAEYLNSQGLLLTPEQDKRIRLEAMNYLLARITDWQPHEFLRRKFDAQHSSSPADMYQCVVEFIEENIEWWEREQ